MKKYLCLCFFFCFTNEILFSQDQNYNLEAAKRVKTVVQILHTNFYDTNWENCQGSTNPWHHKNIWNAYNTLEVLVDYAMATGDSVYLPLIISFADSKCSYDDAKFAGYDDAQWTGIALIKVYKLTNQKKYLIKAIELWEYLVKNSWDETFCEGGFWWNVEETYKNAITNELSIVYSSMLYFVTKDEKYKEWTLKVWTWFEKSGMIAQVTDKKFIKYLVNDGINANCKNNGGSYWTYNQGVIIGGLVNLWHIFNDFKYINLAIDIAKSTINHLTIDGVLVEKPFYPIVSDNLNTDQQQFKGIFFRYLTNLIVCLPSSNENKSIFNGFIEKNLRSVAKFYPDFRIGTLWHKQSLENFNAISQTSGLDLFISLLKIRVKTDRHKTKK